VLLWMWMACAPAPEDESPGASSLETSESTSAQDSGTAEGSLALVINEVMPSNDSTWLDEEGLASDWVELVNVTEASIPWSSVRITDGVEGAWTGSQGSIGAGERVLLGRGDLGFGLDADGDSLSVWVDDTLSDQLDWEEVASDVSLARIPDTSGPWAETAWPTPGAENGEVSPSLDPADATVFVSDRVHTIDFEVTKEAYDLLAEGSGFIGTFIDYQEVEAVMTIDGIRFESVGLRRKGSASTDPLSGKPPFKVDMNEFVKGQRFRSLKGFNLHNGKVNDPTLVHEYLSYRLARESGLAAPRVGWAVVTLNGLDYGIYALVEQHDDVFVERNFPGAGEQGVVLEPNESGDGSWLSVGDFGSNQLDWDFEEGDVPVDPAMIASVEAVNQLVKGPASDEAVAELWDVAEREAVLAYFAWENVIGHTDGYHVPNNWRVYVDPDTKRLQLLPSGADWTWDQPADPWFWGGRLADWCLSNPGCEAGVAAKMVEVADTTEAIDLSGDFDRIWAGIEGLVLSQPRPNHPERGILNAHDRTVDNLVDFPEDARQAACRQVPSVCP